MDGYGICAVFLIGFGFCRDGLFGFLLWVVVRPDGVSFELLDFGAGVGGVYDGQVLCEKIVLVVYRVVVLE